MTHVLGKFYFYLSWLGTDINCDETCYANPSLYVLHNTRCDERLRCARLDESCKQTWLHISAHADDGQSVRRCKRPEGARGMTGGPEVEDACGQTPHKTLSVCQRHLCSGKVFPWLDPVTYNTVL